MQVGNHASCEFMTSEDIGVSNVNAEWMKKIPQLLLLLSKIENVAAAFMNIQFDERKSLFISGISSPSKCLPLSLSLCDSEADTPGAGCRRRRSIPRRKLLTHRDCKNDSLFQQSDTFSYRLPFSTGNMSYSVPCHGESIREQLLGNKTLYYNTPCLVRRQRHSFKYGQN